MAAALCYPKEGLLRMSACGWSLELQGLAYLAAAVSLSTNSVAWLESRLFDPLLLQRLPSQGSTSPSPQIRPNGLDQGSLNSRRLWFTGAYCICMLNRKRQREQVGTRWNQLRWVAAGRSARVGSDSVPTCEGRIGNTVEHGDAAGARRNPTRRAGVFCVVGASLRSARSAAGG